VKLIAVLIALFFGVSLQAQVDEFTFEGLSEPVEILEDHWGISHIYAKNQRDLFFAQGFNVARDRLFQLELWRRRATGTVAEILGPRALQHDIGARLLRVRVDMQEELRHYHPDGEEIVGAFVQGINAWVDHVREHPELLPLEFRVLGLMPGHWTNEVVISRHNGLYRNLRGETSLARAVLAEGVEAILASRDFQPIKPELEVAEGLDLSLITREVTGLQSAARSAIRFRAEDLLAEYRREEDEERPRPAEEADEETPLSEGSNNWVVSGARTFSRKPIMANDPHRSQQIPSLRYWVHLHAPGWNVIGGGEPSLPGISIGHNEHGAWGLTIFSIDQEDLYVYETRPGDPNQYRYGDGWESMRIEKESIPVKGEDAFEATLKFTRHGPVLFEDDENNRAYALRAAWLEIGGAPYLASLRMDQAKNWEEFREACTYSHTPSENMIWADVDGNIGWQAVGITPIRKNWYGLLPVPGDGRFEWDGFLPIKQLPGAFNPAEGFIATANEMNLPLGYPHRLGYSWSDPSRSMRIQEVLGSGRKFTMLDMMKLQLDELSLPARTMTGLLEDLEARSDFGKAALAELKGWDHVMAAESIPAAVFYQWRRSLIAELRRIHAPDMRIPSGPSLQQAIAMLIAPDGRFGKDPIAARDRMLIDALETAVVELEELLGANMADWQYGQPKMHHIQMRHRLSHLLKPEYAQGLDLGPLPRGGSGSTVNQTGSGNQRSGASFRIIADTDNWDASLGTNNPGQSGDPADEQYANLFENWAAGKYFPVLFSRKSVESATERYVKLAPGR
jgi:penicillin amidase